jgi:hypothetical protein
VLKLYNFHYKQKDGILITLKRLVEHFKDAMELAEDIADEHKWKLVHVEQVAVIGLQLTMHPQNVPPQFISHPYKKADKPICATSTSSRRIQHSGQPLKSNSVPLSSQEREEHKLQTKKLIG